MGKEKQLQKSLASRLREWFTGIQMEVWSTDHTSRIDIAMWHKSDTAKMYPIGIEIKTDGKKQGKDLGAWLQQSYTYTQKEFEGYGKLLVCTYPQVTGKYLNEGDEMSKHPYKEAGCLAAQNNVNTFIGSFMVAELQAYEHKGANYPRIVFKGYLIWDGRFNDFRTANLDRLWAGK